MVVRVNTGEITRQLKLAGLGSKEAEGKLIELVYEELRSQAHNFMNKERRNHSLQTTGLVHEAYLRLVDQNQVNWANRAQFFAVCSTMMRRILVNYAKNRHRLKRGGVVRPVALDEGVTIAANNGEVGVVALDESLKELRRLDARQAHIVELRYFGGLTIKETAAVLEISPPTVKRDWTMAKAWLKTELSGESR